jgi:hypothetical protein
VARRPARSSRFELMGDFANQSAFMELKVCFAETDFENAISRPWGFEPRSMSRS